MSIQVVILAAGQGKRMHSSLPKVLHKLGGKTLLEYVLATANKISPVQPIVVYGHQGEVLKNTFSHLPVQWVKQEQQLGTGHALLQALPRINDDDQVLVLYGDVPLISEETLNQLITISPKNAIGILTAQLAQPEGYGRIIRDANKSIIGIIEEKDAKDIERAINEINPGIYLLPAPFLKKYLPTLNNQNSQQEYYLTDLISIAVQNNIPIQSVQPKIDEEILGVNDCIELANLERFYQRKIAEKWLRQGVTILDPNRFDVRGEVQMGRDVVIDVNVILEGRVVIGDGCVIGANTILCNTVLSDQVEVKANSYIEGAEIAAQCVIGPFARIRPGTQLAPHVHIGNFVEVKNSQIGEASKANHLSYIGDSEIGKRVNIGAGTITCNYDGANKHKTIICDDVHIGSDTQLVAPVTIGAGATIGAGSTVIKDAPPYQLTLTHQLSQREIADWQRPVKQESDDR